MLPALVAGATALYNVGRMYDSWKYWDAYRKNTGFTPRYPLKNDVYGLGRGVTIVGSIGRSRRKYTVNRYITNKNRYYYQNFRRY